ncbi:acetyl/propionyl/methylcrotonyl-CoA carboxylase subunit alpha [Nonomuraea cavernae]|uniref:Biotin-dependent 3-methylcrotonyl-coenzyme A carboxylase alpha1 subunit n=1 Tax=Nonomuraea cavernae TaxID=2045107 RepID=A0A918DNB5_9ACTN|nr:biotin carboxylase N-terminal domain-containing protein [Nonomuraea cavernae]MCA2189291.1 ATP-grasp domain-containing protein [Nonomuraea cavernae]GGO76467.1 acetyl/propionyl-CoA carboxylase subuit alpha [Nonomuraea cavernae]
MTPSPHMFDRVLIANRGEIAVRIIRTLRRLGVTSVAVHTASDAGARHVLDADIALQVPKYLDMGAIVAAAVESGAQAVHPGYGFLAENAEFARRCAEAGLVFVGPPPEAIDAMGDKIRAKATVSAAGVPVVPGGAEPDDELTAWADFPALIKPSAGGGGKGMVLVRSAAELPEALESARRTARAAFGDGTLLIERYVENPRHIEIQVLADTHGNVLHLGERECSLQRRHQKIVEEAPSPFVDPAMRDRMGTAAVEAARAVGYVGAGTVEFIVDGTTGEHHFMEMNTRLQVEHPVTELVTGLDLVELQLRAAAGEPLPLTQDQVRLDGHAVEARVYAEDPARGFLPTGGPVLALREPEEVRVDSGLAEGGVVGSEFDPMLAKVVAWAPDREAALRRLDRALGETVILGVTTNIPFLRALVTHPAVRAGRLDTGLVERILPDLLPSAGVPAEVLAAAALVFHARPQGGDPWDATDGWRVGRPAWTTWRLEARGGLHAVQVRGLPERAAEVRPHDLPGVPGSSGADAEGVVPEGAGGGRGVPARIRRDGDTLTVTLGGRAEHYAHVRHGDTLWLGRGGAAWAVTRHRIGDPGDRPGAAGAGDGVVRSPMPGTVLVVKAQQGERVGAGQPLLIVEAMKMEHTVTAPLDGLVAELRAQAGQPVDMDAVLAVITPEEA